MEEQGKNLLQLAEIGKKKFAFEVKDGNICFNLTEMAKNFGTGPAQWLRIKESKRYIKCLADVQKCRTADLLKVKKGGQLHEQGTWANDYRIALEFARWLDPVFSIHVNELVWKLLTKQAVVAEPIGGVWPVIQHGRTGYPRKEILETAGYSYRSGTVARLKKLYPEHHYTIARISCVSAEFAKLRIEQGKVRQLEIKFNETRNIKKIIN
jgi:hypothetical protein